ncbi:Conserved_hypothetical protein [Hexamita inflata]|uniref:Transmembrane protein n=1 Tax=Hexamita inflata TaxID=28002 RepID=A0AA86PCB9_9EUKA|nr:Conserved hypothetical protein [Hexamita inflata]
MFEYIISSLQLNCFTSNTSLLLSAQTRTATFTAQVLKDESQENQLCKLLDNSMFNAKIIVGSYTYTQNLLTFSASKSLLIVFTCSQAGLTGCSTAFQATTASFQFLFPSSNVMVEDSISDLKIDTYNRINCITNQYISADNIQWTIQVLASNSGCKVPIDQSQSALITLIGYPDFVFTKSLPLTGLSSLTQVFQNVIFNCMNDFTGTMQRTCQRAVEFFVNEINCFAELTIEFPGTIPGNTSLSYSRDSAYSLNVKVLTISSSFVQQFDCFASQQATFFDNMIRLNLPYNSSRVNCLKPMNEFIGDYDRIEYILQVQSDLNFIDAKIIRFNVIMDFQNQRPWLACQLETSGTQSCTDKLTQTRSLPQMYAFIVRTFFKGNQVVQTVTSSVSPRYSTVISATVNISKTQFCFHTTDYFKGKTTVQMRFQLMAGAPYYSEFGHDYVLDVRGQIQYPTPEQIYCLNYELNESQVQAYNSLVVSPNITGMISMNSSQMAITEINISPEGTKTNYLEIGAVIAVFLCFIWFIITLHFELRQRQTPTKDIFYKQEVENSKSDIKIQEIKYTPVRQITEVIEENSETFKKVMI